MATRTLENAKSGDQVVILVGADDSQGELFRFEYIARDVTPPPSDHVHEDQEERVDVIAGTLSCRIGGEERQLGPGETLTFPAGVYHAVWNADPSGSRSIGEFRPALDVQKAFEAAFSED